MVELLCKGRLPSVADFGAVSKKVKISAEMTNELLRLDSVEAPEFWIEVNVKDGFGSAASWDFYADLVGAPGKHTFACTLDGRCMTIRHSNSAWSIDVLPPTEDAESRAGPRIDAPADAVKKAAIVVFTTEDPLDATVCMVDIEKLREAFPAHAPIFERGALSIDDHPEKMEMFRAVAHDAFGIPSGDPMKVMFACTVYDPP